MRIYSIQKENYNTQSNFKGVLSPNSAKVVNKIAKEEANHLIRNHYKGVYAGANKLMEIKNNFDSALAVLAEKAKLMHPDTTVHLKRVEETLSRETTPIETFEVIYENNKLGIVLQDTISLLDRDENYENLDKRTIGIIESIEPKDIDRKMLARAISDFSKDIIFDRDNDIPVVRQEVITKYLKVNKPIMSNEEIENLKIRLQSTPKERFNNIMNFHKELSSAFSEEENKVITYQLEKDFESFQRKDRESTKSILKINEKLVDEIFGCDE